MSMPGLDEEVDEDAVEAAKLIAYNDGNQWLRQSQAFRQQQRVALAAEREQDSGSKLAHRCCVWLRSTRAGMHAFLLGNVVRTTLTFVVMLFTWCYTFYCLVQFWADTADLQGETESLRTLCDAASEADSVWWLWYVFIYFLFLTVSD